MPQNKIARRVLPKCQFGLSVAPASSHFLAIIQWLMRILHTISELAGAVQRAITSRLERPRSAENLWSFVAVRQRLCPTVIKAKEKANGSDSISLLLSGGLGRSRCKRR
jgi:hypothetical protein